MAEPERGGAVKPIDKELLDACIHCGLCLPACPTYLATGREMESPRGRIYLLAQWNEGEQELSPRLSEHIDTCLGCLGCQTACPSGVKYEKILNAARPHIAEQRPDTERALMRFSFERILPDYPLLHLGGWFLSLWQKLRLGAVLKW
ncbi:MAG: (Fe-S)-binding protein, partial [Terriglobales bacterium]